MELAIKAQICRKNEKISVAIIGTNIEQNMKIFKII